jgi:hypothetical protein
MWACQLCVLNPARSGRKQRYCTASVVGPYLTRNAPWATFERSSLIERFGEALFALHGVKLACGVDGSNDGFGLVRST